MIVSKINHELIINFSKNTARCSSSRPYRITIKLREKDWLVNFKRVYRLWCKESLKVPRKQHKKRRGGQAGKDCLMSLLHNDFRIQPLNPMAV
jgi:hypothetical protein